LAVALEGQFLKNKSLINCNKEQRRINDEYLTNQQVLECKLSNTEIDNCEKTNIILDLQEKLNDYTYKIEELDFQVSENSNEIVKYKEKHSELIEIIKQLNYHKKILKIDLKFTNLQLYHSKKYSNIMTDENKILIQKIESLENTVDDLLKALKISKSENYSLVKKSIEVGMEILSFENKIHLLENKIKQGDENINKFNNLLQCATTKEICTQKELEKCNSQLHMKIEENNDLHLQLHEMQKDLKNTHEKWTYSQQQLESTELELKQEQIKYKIAKEKYKLQENKCEEILSHMDNEQKKLNYSQEKVQETVIELNKEQSEKKIVTEEHNNEIKSWATKSIQTDLSNVIESIIVNKSESPEIVSQMDIGEKEEKIIASSDVVNGQLSKDKDK
jgi:chromosome segregation ATPase